MSHFDFLRQGREPSIDVLNILWDPDDRCSIPDLNSIFVEQFFRLSNALNLGEVFKSPEKFPTLATTLEPP